MDRVTFASARAVVDPSGVLRWTDPLKPTKQADAGRVWLGAPSSAMRAAELRPCRAGRARLVLVL